MYNDQAEERAGMDALRRDRLGEQEEVGRASSWRVWVAVVRSLGFILIRMGGCLRDLSRE